MTDLLPCPFCGGPAVNHSHASCDCCGQAYTGIVACTKCPAEVTHLDTSADAEKAWNARVSQPAPAGREAILKVLQDTIVLRLIEDEDGEIVTARVGNMDEIADAPAALSPHEPATSVSIRDQIEDLLCEGNCKNPGMCNGAEVTWCGRQTKAIMALIAAPPIADRALALIDDYEQHGSLDHGIAFELRRALALPRAEGGAK